MIKRFIKRERLKGNEKKIPMVKLTIWISVQDMENCFMLGPAILTSFERFITLANE